MSYILDALRKADSEREQGRVPGLHSQLGPAPTGSDAPAPRETGSRLPWLLAGASSGALLVALALWWLNAPPAPVDVVTPPVAARPSPTPAPQTEVETAAPPLVRVTPVMPPDVPVAAPPPPPAAPAPAPAPGSLSRASPAADTAPAPAAPVNRATGVASTGSGIHVDPAGTASQDAIVPLEQLSDAQRRALPTLVIGGAMHSDNPGSRMLIINNGVYREGDQPAPGLVLEEIRLKSAVFRYQGQRYSVRY